MTGGFIPFCWVVAWLSSSYAATIRSGIVIGSLSVLLLLSLDLFLFTFLPLKFALFTVLSCLILAPSLNQNSKNAEGIIQVPFLSLCFVAIVYYRPSGAEFFIGLLSLFPFYFLRLNLIKEGFVFIASLLILCFSLDESLISVPMELGFLSVISLACAINAIFDRSNNKNTFYFLSLACLVYYFQRFGGAWSTSVQDLVLGLTGLSIGLVLSLGKRAGVKGTLLGLYSLSVVLLFEGNEQGPIHFLSFSIPVLFGIRSWELLSGTAKRAALGAFGILVFFFFERYGLSLAAFIHFFGFLLFVISNNIRLFEKTISDRLSWVKDFFTLSVLCSLVCLPKIVNFSDQGTDKVSWFFIGVSLALVGIFWVPWGLKFSGVRAILKPWLKVAGNFAEAVIDWPKKAQNNVKSLFSRVLIPTQHLSAHLTKTSAVGLKACQLLFMSSTQLVFDRISSSYNRSVSSALISILTFFYLVFLSVMVALG